jgi:hypothetical protein
MHPRLVLDDAIEACGWTEDQQIQVLLRFIEQMNRVEPNFKRYIESQIDKETEYEEDAET